MLRNRGWIAAGIILVGVALRGTIALGDAPPATPPEPDFAAIDAYVERVRSDDGVVGLALAIVHGNHLVHARGFGTTARGGAAVTVDTPFMLGSMSKAFTALAIMKLVEAGKLELDVPVTDYLPWFKVAPADGVDSGVPLTLAHLLNHTSGIGRDADPPGGAVTTLEQRVRHIATVRLESPVGTRHSYASANYQVLGLVVETVSGTSFGAFVREEVFAPLGMTKSFVAWDVARDAGAAVGHRYWFGRTVPADLPYEADRLPTAAILASAADLARFEQMHLDAGRFDGRAIVSPATMAELLRPTAKAGDASYAMGWRVGVIAGVTAIHHGGILPHYRGKMVMLPDERWGIVVLTNTSSELGTPTSHRLADDVAAMLVGHSARVSATPLQRIYLFADLGALLVALATLKELAGLRRFRASLNRRDVRARRKAIASVVLSIGIAAGLLSCPWAFGLPWSEAFRVVPDFTGLLLVTQMLALAMALAKGWWLRQTSRAVG